MLVLTLPGRVLRYCRDHTLYRSVHPVQTVGDWQVLYWGCPDQVDVLSSIIGIHIQTHQSP